MPTIMRSMNVISRCSNIYKTDKLRLDDIGGCHHAFIFTICRNPGMSQDMIAKEICLNKSTVTRTLGYLEERGYITREHDEKDKRSLLVYPTDKMLAILPSVRAIAAEWNEALADGIPEDELEIFRSVLVTMQKRAMELAVSDTDNEQSNKGAR